MIDVAKACAYVEARGTVLEKARMRYILQGAEPDEQIVQLIAELQNSDGGFPYRRLRGNPSTVSDTLTVLWWMDELGLLDGTASFEACRYLFALQRDNGGWDEDSFVAQFDPPPWIRPGDLRASLYLSSYTAYWLALMGYRMHPAFQRALNFLQKYQGEGGRFHGFRHTTWIATSVFVMAGSAYTGIVDRGLRFLMEQPFSAWEASQISWALDCLGRAGLSRGRPFIDQALTELPQRQRADGSWSSEDGEAYAVGATIQTVKVLKHYGLLPEEEDR